MPNLSALMPGAVKSTQRGTITVGSGNTSATATVTSVDPAKSQLRMLGASSTSSTGGPEEYLARVALTNATTITATRSGTTQNVTISWELTEYF